MSVVPDHENNNNYEDWKKVRFCLLKGSEILIRKIAWRLKAIERFIVQISAKFLFNLGETEKALLLKEKIVTPWN